MIDQVKLNQKFEGKKKTQGLNSIYNYMQIKECKLDYKKTSKQNMKYEDNILL